MGTLYKRPNSPNWWIKYGVPGRGTARETSGTRSKKLAQALLNKRQAEAWEGRYYPVKRAGIITLKEISDKWLLGQQVGRSLGDAKVYHRRINAFFGHRLIRDIDCEHIYEFILYLQERKRMPGTINNYLKTLRAWFGLAHRGHYIDRDIMQEIKLLPEERDGIRVITPREFEFLLLGVKDPDLRLAMIICYHCGTRLGETSRITHEMIDLSRFIEGYTLGQFVLPASITKTKVSRRVPFPREVYDAMLAHPSAKDGRPNTRLMSKTQPQLTALFRRLCWRLKIVNVTFHDFRKTFFTNAADAGIDLLTIARITGHQSWRTLEVYRQVSPKHLHVAIGQVHRSGDRQAYADLLLTHLKDEPRRVVPQSLVAPVAEDGQDGQDGQNNRS